MRDRTGSPRSPRYGSAVELRRILAGYGVRTPFVTPDAGATLVKTRLFRGGELLVRLEDELGDRVDRAQVDLRRRLDAGADALLISDYDYGALADPVPAPAGGLPPVVVVDARRLERWRPLRPTVATCDAAQAARICGFDVTAAPGRRAEAAVALLEATGAGAVAITLGSSGAVLLRSGRTPLIVAAPHVVPGTVVGSGDVFAAALTVGLAGGLDVAPAAARAVVTATHATIDAAARNGTAVVPHAPVGLLTGAHLGPAPAPDDDADLTPLATWAEDRHREGARIVMAGGCFDLLHEGHVALLAQAAEMGDLLVVAVNDDDGVRDLKGPDRPIVDLEGRRRVLRALESVDHVIAFRGTSPSAVVEAVRPHVFVKGSDYTEENLPEAPLLRRLGVEIRFLDMVADRSTTHMVQRAAAATRRGR
jgi:D-beta-D-heptose 7-phosphate kinase / D-beta-D-heptose 1-phosphate adenosyltransferase